MSMVCALTCVILCSICLVFEFQYSWEWLCGVYFFGIVGISFAVHAGNLVLDMNKKQELIELCVDGHTVTKVVRYRHPSDIYEVIDKQNNTFYIYKNYELNKWFMCVTMYE